MRAEGFVYGLDERTYHSERDSLSVSGAKTLLKAPALFQWERDHPVHRDVFDFGSAAHELVLGIGPGIAIIPATSRAKADQVAHKEAKESVRAEGMTPVTAEDYEHIQAMADVLSSHTLAMRLLSDGEPEVSAYAVDEATGVMRRGRFDWLGSNILTDYKTCQSANPRDLAGRYGSVVKFGYDQQAAWYLDLARSLGHPAAAFAFIFQEKTAPHLVTVAYVDEADLYGARARNARALELFAECTASGVWGGYLPEHTATVLSLTQQTYELETVQ